MSKALNSQEWLDITKTTPHALFYKFTSDYNLSNEHTIAFGLPEVFFII